MSGRPIWKRQAARKYEDERLRRIRSKQRKLGVRFSFSEWWAMSDVQVQVCEGWWNLRDGRQVKVWRDTSNERRPWFGEHGGIRFSWMSDGRYHAGTNSPADLVEHVGQLPEAQAEPAPEPQPVQVREGVWLTRDGEHVEVRARDMTGNESSEWRWHGRRKNYLAAWRNDGTLSVSGEQSKGDLVQFLRPLPEPTPAPTPETEPQPMQVREGVWLTRDGREARVWVNCDPQTNSIWPWEGRVGDFEETWKENGGYRRESVEHICDLVQYVGPLPEPEAEPTPEPAPETAPKPQPVQVRPGIWRTRSGHEVEVRENIGRLTPDFPWRGALFDSVEIWRNNGRWVNDMHYDHRDLVEYVGPLPQQTTTDTVAEIDWRVGETLQQALERTRITNLCEENEALKAERDRLLVELAAASDLDLEADDQHQQVEIMATGVSLNAAHEALRRQFCAMTSERDRVQAELAAATELLQNERFEAQQAHAGRKRAEEHLETVTAEVQQLQAELRQARIEIDAEKETPASSCKAIVDAHLVGAQSGKQAAFEAVLRWIGPLVGAESDDAAALLHALPGCLSRLAEQEGVTL